MLVVLQEFQQAVLHVFLVINLLVLERVHQFVRKVQQLLTKQILIISTVENNINFTLLHLPIALAETVHKMSQTVPDVPSRLQTELSV